tara:strand:- start:159 stop:599 length:441 start_codon:yes stop_codon:yes gene_type:complete
MLPEGMADLGIAFVLLVLLAVAGAVVQELDLLESEDEKNIKLLNLEDANELLLLNYVKVNTESGEMRELIKNAEDNDEIFEVLKDETDSLMGFGKVRKYDVRINYQSGQKRIGDDEFEDYKEIKLVDENGEIITVEMGVEFREEWV